MLKTKTKKMFKDESNIILNKKGNPNLSYRVRQLIYKLLGRKMIFTVVKYIEFYLILILLMYDKLELSWMLIALIVEKDVVVLTFTGYLTYEKIKFEGKLGLGK